MSKAGTKMLTFQDDDENFGTMFWTILKMKHIMGNHHQLVMIAITKI